MAETKDTFAKIVTELGLVLYPLETALKSPGTFMSFMQRLGWDSNDIPAPLKDLGEAVTRLIDVIRDAMNQDLKPEKIFEIKGSIEQAINAINAIKTAPDAAIPQKLRDDNFKTEFPLQLIQYLVSDYLLRQHSGVASFLKATGVLRTTYQPAQGNRPPFVQYHFAFADLPKLIDNPELLLTNAYGWGTPDFDIDGFLRALENVFLSLTASVMTKTVSSHFFHTITDASTPFNFPMDDGEQALGIVFFERQRTNSERLAAEMTLMRLPAKNDLMPGLMLIPEFNGVNAFTMQLGPGISVTISSQVDFKGGIAVLARPGQGLSVVTGFNNTEVPSQANASFNVRADFEGDPKKPYIILGSATGSRVAFDGIGLNGGLAIRTDESLELFSEFQLKKFKIVINFSEGDGFIQKLIPLQDIETNADLTIGISNVRGIYFSGSGSLELRIPTHLTLGPLEINDTTLSIKPENGKLPVAIGLSLKANLGPLQVVVEDIGLKINLQFPPISDFVGFDIGFKPPTGVGLSINAGAVIGGGYLFFDFDKEEYAGALELTIANLFSAKAIGLVTTKMPDGSKGFSLLIIITAEFNPPFQLGYGFTLNAVGGLLGLNRTMMLDPLRDAVRTGAVNSIMFPQNVIVNAPRIISDLRTIFPPYEGKFLIGPMAKLGWGTPTIISLSFGLIIEIPGNIAILGKLTIALPEESIALVKIQVLFVGTLDFDKKMLTIDASLYDSFILTMTLEGDMAVRLKWGEDPDFILTAGGFHPSYTPPPLALPTLRRMAINILNTDVAKIRVECYQAVTSNTVQFGSKAELYFGFSSISISGHIQFDALFQFSPFYFIAEVSSSVSLEIFSMGLYSIRLRFTLEGTTPWRAKGQGSISFFFFDVSADFDKTWGESKDTSLPDITILPKFLEEIRKQEQWSTVLSIGKNLLVSLRKLDDVTPVPLVLHPAGSLVVQQKLLPLTVKIDKIGNQKTNDVQLIAVSKAFSGGEELTVNSVNENFARAQYQDLADAEKLSKPSFEKMPGGVSISAKGTTIKNGTLARRQVAYEVTIIDKEPQKASKRGKLFEFGGLLFAHLLKGASVSDSPLSKHQSDLKKPFAEKLDMIEEGYTVAFQASNKAFSGSATFGSEIMAQTYMQEQVAKNPKLKKEIHIIPNYELQEA